MCVLLYGPIFFDNSVNVYVIQWAGKTVTEPVFFIRLTCNYVIFLINFFNLNFINPH